MVEELRLSTFEAHLNSSFLVTDGTHKAEVTLVDALDKSVSGPSTKTPTVEQFSLRFRGPAKGVLPQGNYRFSHPEIGDFDIFITPVINSDQDGTYYQAGFSRIPGLDRRKVRFGIKDI